MKTIHEKVADAVRALGESLLRHDKADKALDSYERKLYPEGTTIGQQVQLEKDPKWGKLWKTVKLAELSELACTYQVLKLAKRMVRKEKKEATKC